ncbi:reverse transcriptase domain-containing protein [Tanacetum coccineum]
MEPWHSDSGGQPEEAIQQTPMDATLADKPAKKNRVTTENLDRPSKHKHRNNADFYNKPFTFAETEKDIRDLVASPFTAQIRDYDMPDGLKVLMNLKTYDGTSDPDDHLTIFMGTMDVHQLPEPAWCRFFHITLCGAARFWFGKETLDMTDRSDGMMTGAFISDLSPGRLFKDLIARPPIYMEDLFTQAHNFIRADEANIENRLRDSRWANNRRGQSYRDTSRRPRDKHTTRPNRRPGEHSNTHRPSFTPLLKSPAEIYATSEGREGSCRLEAKNCGDEGNNEVFMTNGKWSQPCHESRTSQPSTNIAFSNDDPIPEHCNGENPLIIKADIGGCMIHRIYVDGGSSTEIMYEHCFQQLSNEAKVSIRALTSPLVDFAGQVSWPLGIITVPLTLFYYNGNGSKTIMTDFMIVRAPSPYNVILGVAVLRGDILRKIECTQSDTEAISETQ